MHNVRCTSQYPRVYRRNNIVPTQLERNDLFGTKDSLIRLYNKYDEFICNFYNEYSDKRVLSSRKDRKLKISSTINRLQDLQNKAGNDAIDPKHD